MSARRTALPIVSAPPDWPHRLLDPLALRASGWHPTPFRDVVLKIHQRCNLACDYCYVYTMADQSWRDRPLVMDRHIWQATAERMREHAARHALPDMRLVLHGGEPLLVGAQRLRQLIADFRAVFTGSDCRLDIQMQSNGILLDAAMLDLLVEHGIRVGVSIDGTAADNDRHRRRPDGKGSHAAVHQALTLLASERYRPAYAGLLSTVDPDTDPIECYEHLLSHRPPTVDLLLPHANWSAPPARRTGPTPYADWLITVFDRWYSATEQEIGLRLFEDVIVMTLGGAGSSEQVGTSPVAVVVVESDGSIEQVDSLKSAYSGACDTGLFILRNSLDDAFDHPGIAARQIGVAALSDTCQACPIHSICGGGHYAHRYRPASGFRQPSVYCADLLKLIHHIRSRVAADVQRLLVDNSR